MQTVESLSPDTRALADRLVATQVGDTITFGQMSDAIGRDIAARRHLIPRAIAIAAREAGAIFGSIRGVGYRRLEPAEAHILGAHARQRLRRSTRRASDAILSAVTRANDLPEPAKLRAYAEVNALSLLRHLATDKVVSAAAGEAKPEPVAVTARRFAEHLGIMK
jgi:hypothetical protein